MHRGQTSCDLRSNFQRQLSFKAARASDELLERFPFYKLHRIKVILTAPTQMEDRGDIRVTDARGRARFTQKTKPSRLVAQISLADDFQCQGQRKSTSNALYVTPIAPRPSSTCFPYSSFANS